MDVNASFVTKRKQKESEKYNVIDGMPFISFPLLLVRITLDFLGEEMTAPGHGDCSSFFFLYVFFNCIDENFIKKLIIQGAHLYCDPRIVRTYKDIKIYIIYHIG